MKPASNVKRSRGRGGRKVGGGGSRQQTFDSNGPSVRIRGSAMQIYEKYSQLSRDHMSNDRVAAENLAQHAEHYFRVAQAQAQQQMQAQQQHQQNQQQHNGNQQSGGHQGGFQPREQRGGQPNGAVNGAGRDTGDRRPAAGNGTPNGAPNGNAGAPEPVVVVEAETAQESRTESAQEDRVETTQDSQAEPARETRADAPPRRRRSRAKPAAADAESPAKVAKAASDAGEPDDTPTDA